MKPAAGGIPMSEIRHSVRHSAITGVRLPHAHVIGNLVAVNFVRDSDDS